MPNQSCCAANRVPSVARTPRGRDNPVEHRPPGKDSASDADRSAAENGVVQAHRQADCRYQHIFVAADQVPMPAERVGCGAKHPPPSALDDLTTPRLRYAAVDEVPEPGVKACRLGVEWLPVLGEPSNGDKHRGSLSLGDGQRSRHGAVPPAGCGSAITLPAKSPQPRWTSR